MSSAARRRSIAPGWARTTSARSPRASPISVVTFPRGGLGEVPELGRVPEPARRERLDEAKRQDRRCHVLEDFHPENVREQRPKHAPDAQMRSGPEASPSACCHRATLSAIARSMPGQCRPRCRGRRGSRGSRRGRVRPRGRSRSSRVAPARAPPGSRAARGTPPRRGRPSRPRSSAPAARRRGGVGSSGSGSRSTKSRLPASCKISLSPAGVRSPTGKNVRSAETPSGFIGSVIICTWPNET